jgi:hypothetical protein
MPQRTYALARGETKRLKVQWDRQGRARVFLDSNELAPTESSPPRYRLPDGSMLALHLDEGGPDILREGERLPGSRFDPQHQLLVAVSVLLAVAVLHFAVQWIPLEQWLPRDFPLNGYFGWAPAVGLAYLVLGFLLYYRSRAALYTAMTVSFVEASALATLYLMHAHYAHFKLALAMFAPFAMLFVGSDALDQLKPRESVSTETA